MTATPGSHADWYSWHQVYDEPGSRYTSRLERVQAGVRRYLDTAPPGPIVVTDVCGGQGRCVLPVVEGHSRIADIRYQLLEIDERNVERAREEAARLGVDFVERIVDAGCSDAYVGLERADLIVMSGLFIHMRPRERARTVRHLPEICAARARLLWTLKDGAEARRLARDIRRAGFTDVSEPKPPGVRQRVGEGTLDREPAALVPGVRWFRFGPVRQTRRNQARVALGRWRRTLFRQPMPD